MAYSDFAVHCHTECLNGRPDPLNEYGPAAFYLAKSSKRFQHRLATLLGLAEADFNYVSDLENAETFVRSTFGPTTRLGLKLRLFRFSPKLYSFIRKHR